MYYNTTNQTNPVLSKYKCKEIPQTKKVYMYFVVNKNSMFTPFQVYNAIFNDNTPITSIRRAITNLTNEGYLVKTNTQIIEDLGRPNYCWRFNDNQTI